MNAAAEGARGAIGGVTEGLLRDALHAAATVLGPDPVPEIVKLTDGAFVRAPRNSHLIHNIHSTALNYPPPPPPTFTHSQQMKVTMLEPDASGLPSNESLALAHRVEFHPLISRGFHTTSELPRPPHASSPSTPRVSDATTDDLFMLRPTPRKDPSSAVGINQHTTPTHAAASGSSLLLTGTPPSVAPAPVGVTGDYRKSPVLVLWYPPECPTRLDASPLAQALLRALVADFAAASTDLKADIKAITNKIAVAKGAVADAASAAEKTRARLNAAEAHTLGLLEAKRSQAARLHELITGEKVGGSPGEKVGGSPGEKVGGSPPPLRRKMVP